MSAARDEPATDAAAAGAPRRLGRGRRALWALVAAGLALGLAEGAARVGYRGRWPYYLVWDDALLWRPRPGWSGTLRGDVAAAFDDLGLRDERAWRGRPGARVLVVGDSVAFGYRLAQGDTIARRLEARLGAARPDRPLVALNAGVEGHGPEQTAVLLERLVPAVEPALVVWVLCLKNDVSVEPIASALARDTAFNPGTKSLAARDRALRALLERSALAWWVARGVAARARDRDRAETAAAARAQAEAQGAGSPGPGEREAGLRFSTLAELVALPPAAVEAELAALRAHLARGAAAARAGGARVALALVPDDALLEGRVDRSIVDRLLALAAGLDLPALDLLPAMQAAARAGGPPLLREKDGVHPTAAGADWIAGELAAWLVGLDAAPPQGAAASGRR